MHQLPVIQYMYMCAELLCSCTRYTVHSNIYTVDQCTQRAVEILEQMRAVEILEHVRFVVIGEQMRVADIVEQMRAADIV